MKKLSEVEALMQVDSAFAALDDQEARNRILRWAMDKYANQLILGTQQADLKGGDVSDADSRERNTPRVSGNEMPGIAKLIGEELKIIARDIKAASTNDAAIRLELMAIRAHEKLTGSESVSSRHVITPILKSWRCYTANTRKAIANHKGIIRTGDMLSLDHHAKSEADQYIEECLDPNVEGSWKPSSSGRKSSKKGASKKAKKAAK